MSVVIRLSDERRRRGVVAFTRPELNKLLSLYSRRVMSGEWRDYAIDMGRGRATFSIFRHSAEGPLYRICKVPVRKSGQCEFMVFEGPRRLHRSASLQDALSMFQRQLRIVS